MTGGIIYQTESINFMEEQTPHQCPDLGILDDPNTSHSFPSSWNACFHAKSPSVPTFEHQEAICLTDGYVACPVYQAAKGGVFPADLLNTVKPPKQESQRPTRIYGVIAGALVLLLLAVGAIFAFGSKIPASAGFSLPGLNSNATKTMRMDETAVIKATSTFAITITPTPTIFTTETPTPKPTMVVFTPFVLETPFKIGDQDFLLHRIQDGEGLDLLAKKWHTTSEIIQRLNYLIKVPIRAGTLLLIRPDIIDLGDEEPVFEIHIVNEKTILLDDLAKKLNADLEKLKYYNNCTGNCQIKRDDWVLIPRHQ